MPELQGHVQSAAVQALGGLVAVLLFILALAAFVVQSSLTQYVQGTLGFRQPFFLLYAAHSSFTVIFPLHLLCLVMTTRRPVQYYFFGLKTAIVSRLSPAGVRREQFPTARFIGMVFAFAMGLNIPGMLWYASVSLASISDVTAIWNTNSFWVYLLTVRLYRRKWETRKLGAVILACFGVILDVYGGSRSSRPPEKTVVAEREEGPSAPLLGDVLTIAASISYALYQVLYKLYAALPNDNEGEDGGDRSSFSYESLSDSMTVSSAPGERDPANDESMKLPFGLYPNFFTSCMGFCTLLTFALGFPLLHWLSIERFTLPPDRQVLACVVAIASSGVVFNSCFMILLGIWGPVLTSVGSLLTIVLVMITDVLFNGDLITIWSLLGAGMIIAAFGVLVVDMVQQTKQSM